MQISLLLIVVHVCQLITHGTWLCIFNFPFIRKLTEWNLKYILQRMWVRYRTLKYTYSFLSVTCVSTSTIVSVFETAPNDPFTTKNSSRFREDSKTPSNFRRKTTIAGKMALRHVNVTLSTYSHLFINCLSVVCPSFTAIPMCPSSQTTKTFCSRRSTMTSWTLPNVWRFSESTAQSENRLFAQEQCLYLHTCIWIRTFT